MMRETSLDQLRARRAELASKLEELDGDDKDRQAIEGMLAGIDRVLGTSLPSAKVVRKLSQAQDDLENGVLVSSIPCGDGKEMRVYIKETDQGREVCLRLYYRHRGLNQMLPSRRGMSFDALVLGPVIDGLMHAQQYVPTKGLAL